MQELEELETKCDTFLSNHTHIQDNAKQLSTQYEDFLSIFEPMEGRLLGVVSELSALCEHVPPLAHSIQQLCVSIRGQVTSRRNSIETRANVLIRFDQFCSLVHQVSGCGYCHSITIYCVQVNSDLSKLDEYLSNSVEEVVSMETLSTYKQLMDRLRDNYNTAKKQGGNVIIVCVCLYVCL